MAQLNSTQLNSTQLNSTQLNSTQLNSTQLNSTQLNSTQLNSTQLNSTQLNSTQLNSTQLNSTQLNSTQLNSTQLNSTQLNNADKASLSFEESSKASNKSSQANACDSCWLARPLRPPQLRRPHLVRVPAFTNLLLKTLRNLGLLECRYTRISRFRQARGFSLVELMVVVAIMGVLASIAIPSFQSYRRRAWQSEAKSSLTHIYTAEQNFHSKWGVYIGALHPAGVDFRGDLRYGVGFSGPIGMYGGQHGFCGNSGRRADGPFVMGKILIGHGSMAAQEYTGAMQCARHSSVSGRNDSDYCRCRNNQCMFVGALTSSNTNKIFPFSSGNLTLTPYMQSSFVRTKVECEEFAAGAVSNIKGNAMYDGLDIWGITHQKVLKHVKSGL